MIDRSLARNPAPFTLFRVHPDGTEEPVPNSETADQVACIEHGHKLSREEPGCAFTMRRDGRAVYRFCHQRLVPRLGLGRVGALLPVLS